MSATVTIHANLAHARAWLADDAKVTRTAEFAFQKADKDESGCIEAGEVKGMFAELLETSGLGSLAQMPSDYYLQKHLKNAETNKNGQLSLQDWTSFLKGFMSYQLAEDCACTNLWARTATKDTSKTVGRGAACHQQHSLA